MLGGAFIFIMGDNNFGRLFFVGEIMENKYIIKNNTLFLFISDKTIVLCDVDDYNKIKDIVWKLKKSKTRKDQMYIFGYIKELQKNVTLHRIIMNAKKGEIIDHINRDTLDNRKSNLRKCNASQNQANRKPTKKTSKYLGVCKQYNKWRAQVTKDRVHYHIGTYDTEIEAAKAYDKAAKKYHGEFANPNFV